MSLTIFLHNKKPEVDIIQWFLDQERTLAWTKAPIVTMPAPDFRERGYDWICQHFLDYKRIRLRKVEIIKHNDLFREKSVKQVMEDSDVISIKSHEDHWFLTPYVVRRNSFPAGMERLEKDKERVVPANCARGLFWQTFDEVFQFTHWYST